MKKQPIKFSEYPLIVPNAKRLSKKMDKLISDLKACQNANEAFKVINKINSYFEELETETSVIYVLYTCNTTNEEYKKELNKKSIMNKKLRIKVYSSKTLSKIRLLLYASK